MGTRRIIYRTFVAVAAVAAAGVVGLAGYFLVLKPERAEPARVKVAATKARIERGEYLFRLADCDGCHSGRDFSRFNGPVVEGRRGAGMVFPASFGLPGKVVASNITSDPETGIGKWTDGEKMRAIREGIARDGRALFPMMPYEFYRHMSDDDVESLVAFLNTLPPVKNALARTRVDFPVSVLMRTAPRPVSRVPDPERGDAVKYGRYLATLGSCEECHTQYDKGKPRPGMTLAGGRLFRFPDAAVASSNITPDRETGIGVWSEQDFVQRFYQYRRYVERGSPAVGPEGFTLMPWLNLCQLPEGDLKAIYAYLRTQKPVKHRVETRPPLQAGM